MHRLDRGHGLLFPYFFGLVQYQRGVPAKAAEGGRRPRQKSGGGGGGDETFIWRTFFHDSKMVVPVVNWVEHLDIFYKQHWLEYTEHYISNIGTLFSINPSFRDLFE